MKYVLPAKWETVVQQHESPCGGEAWLARIDRVIDKSPYAPLTGEVGRTNAHSTSLCLVRDRDAQSYQANPGRPCDDVLIKRSRETEILLSLVSQPFEGRGF